MAETMRDAIAMIVHVGGCHTPMSSRVVADMIVEEVGKRVERDSIVNIINALKREHAECEATQERCIQNGDEEARRAARAEARGLFMGIRLLSEVLGWQ